MDCLEDLFIVDVGNRHRLNGGLYAMSTSVGAEPEYAFYLPRDLGNLVREESLEVITNSQIVWFSIASFLTGRSSDWRSSTDRESRLQCRPASSRSVSAGTP